MDTFCANSFQFPLFIAAIHTFCSMFSAFCNGGSRRKDNPRSYVVDAMFCIRHPMHLILRSKKKIFKSTILEVLHTNGNQLFRIVNGDSLKNHEWSILDTTDSPVASLHRKAFSSKWRVYGGNNNQKEDALFIVKRQEEDELTLNVYMGSAGVKRKGRGEFDVVGFPPTIYKGDAMIANVNNNFSWGEDDSVKKGGFKVRVSAGTDYMFILSLIMIHKEMALLNYSTSCSAAIVNGIEIGGAILSSTSGGGA